MRPFLYAAMAAMLLASGCATAPGQLSIIEWDSRSKEQIEASTKADIAVYETQSAVVKEETSSRAFTEWKAFFDLISGIRVRIRVIWIQWGCGK